MDILQHSKIKTSCISAKILIIDTQSFEMPML